jgi:hypothetical protein
MRKLSLAVACVLPKGASATFSGRAYTDLRDKPHQMQLFQIEAFE